MASNHLKPEPEAEPLFVDAFVDDAPKAIIIDRSTAERYATCPHQGAIIDSRMVSTGSVLTDVGSEVHRVISEAIKARAEGMNTIGVREVMATGAQKSRPDVQPQVIDALNVYRVTNLICMGDTAERHPADIIRFDGGEHEASGQVATQLFPAEGDRPPVIITCELDFLAATASTVEVDLLDWKSGWRHWTAGLVAQSFQFQWYAFVIWRNYPRVERVRVRVVETRSGNTTGEVVFTREKHEFPITARIETAVGNYLQYRGQTPAKVPAWPEPDKCATCDAALQCKLAHEPAADVARDPEGAVRQLIVLQTAADRLKASLSVAVRKQGKDFVFDDVAFGVGKPKAQRAAACDYYETPGRVMQTT